MEEVGVAEEREEREEKVVEEAREEEREERVVVGRTACLLSRRCHPNCPLRT